MKKNLLFVSLLSMVFLWLGNVSLWYSVGCADEYQAMTSANAAMSACASHYEGETTPISQLCSNESSAAISAVDIYNQCKAENPSDTNPTQCSDIQGWINQNPGWGCPTWYTPDGINSLQCCNPEAVWSTWTYCQNTPSSSLNNDPHAFVSISWVSCACEKWYGEYYNTDWSITCELCSRDDVCCGTKLNTKIPFIGDCIESSSQASGSVINETTAFPILISALVKIIISVILIASFILIIVAGVRWSAGDAKWGKDMIIKVAVWLAILWASGVILRLINPNFFG